MQEDSSGPVTVRTNDNDRDNQLSHDTKSSLSSPTSAAITTLTEEEDNVSQYSDSSGEHTPGSKDLNYYTAAAAAESGRLHQLRADRAARESALRQNFLDSQSLAKSKFEQNQEDKEKIHVLEIQVLQLSKQLKESQAELDTLKSTTTDDESATYSGQTHDQVTKSADYVAQLEEELKIVTSKLLQLECDRAYGEHELRKRIHRDAYKAKTRIATLKNELQIAQDRAADLEEVAATLDQDFQSFREGTEGTISELLEAKSRISTLQKELKKLPRDIKMTTASAEAIKVEHDSTEAKSNAGKEENGPECTSLSHRLSGMLQSQVLGGGPDARVAALEEENRQLRKELVEQQAEFRQESMMLKKKIREISDEKT